MAGSRQWSRNSSQLLPAATRREWGGVGRGQGGASEVYACPRLPLHYRWRHMQRGKAWDVSLGDFSWSCIQRRSMDRALLLPLAPRQLADAAASHNVQQTVTDADC
jgi:hypothetical protein